MRTCCQKISTSQQTAENRREDRTAEPLLEEGPEILTNSMQAASESHDYEEQGTLKSEAKKKTKSELIAERHPKKHKRGKGPPGNPPQKQSSSLGNLSSKLVVPLSWETSKSTASGGKIVLFVSVPLFSSPFIHDY